jgi:hypothetical protein
MPFLARKMRFDMIAFTPLFLMSVISGLLFGPAVFFCVFMMRLLPRLAAVAEASLLHHRR